MKIEFDPAKNRRNVELRGLAFDLVADFDFDSAWLVIDDRKDYGEIRYRAIGLLKDEIVVIVFILREEAVRVISLRLASRKERQGYEEKKQEQL
jgi:uncharacterized protein